MKRQLITAAAVAALLAGTGLASAQSGSEQGTSPNNTIDRNASGAQAGSATNVNLSSDQRMRIRETVIMQSNAPRMSRSEIDFPLSVGTVVPRSIRVATLPAAVVAVHPAWRGHSYIVVSDEIVILEPETLRIVAVVPA